MNALDLQQLKEEIYIKCRQHLDEKIVQLRAALQELKQSAEAESKSTAGDKHETGRAMIHLEQEKITAQLDEVHRLQNELVATDIKASSSKIAKGSLIKTDKGILFLSVAIGRIQLQQTSVVVLSTQSPLGSKLMGLASGDELTYNETRYQIEQVR